MPSALPIWMALSIWGILFSRMMPFTDWVPRAMESMGTLYPSLSMKVSCWMMTHWRAEAS